MANGNEIFYTTKFLKKIKDYNQNSTSMKFKILIVYNHELSLTSLEINLVNGLSKNNKLTKA